MTVRSMTAAPRGSPMHQDHKSTAHQAVQGIMVDTATEHIDTAGLNSAAGS